VVRALANDVIVMRNGKVVEQGPADEIFDHPQTDYTKALMAAAFNLEDRLRRGGQRIGRNMSRHCNQGADPARFTGWAPERMGTGAFESRAGASDDA
jgi:ABC-type dipeptide/oligopeptide/nickel transport system ATPase component